MRTARPYMMLAAVIVLLLAAVLLTACGNEQAAGREAGRQVREAAKSAEQWLDGFSEGFGCGASLPVVGLAVTGIVLAVRAGKPR